MQSELISRCAVTDITSSMDLLPPCGGGLRRGVAAINVSSTGIPLPNLPPQGGKEYGALASLFLLALTALFLPAITAAQDIIQNAETSQDYISEVLPYPIDEVYDRALVLFDSNKRDFYEDFNFRIYQLPEDVRNYKDLSPEAYKRFMALPIVRPNKFYVFFGAYPNVQDVITSLTPLAAMGHSNAALQRYVTLPISSRTYDLYLWSPDTPFWYSEYTLDGKQLPFRTFFILHLSAVDASHTQAEIIENEPVVRLAGRTSVDIHGAVHPYELREVEPTNRDREFLLSCLSQFIERNVPGRHWFNCREKGEVVVAPVPFTVP